MKRIALLLLVVGACKTTDSQPPPQPADPTPTPTVRTARPAPSLPAAPEPMADSSQDERHLTVRRSGARTMTH